MMPSIILFHHILSRPAAYIFNVSIYRILINNKTKTKKKKSLCTIYMYKVVCMYVH